MSLSSAISIEDVYRLLPGTRVIGHGQVDAAAINLDHFRGEASGHWSGFGIRLDDGSHLIVYNDSHPETRRRATLMEEFFHLKLEHEPSQIRLLGNGNRERSHNNETERIAFGSGAAALIPYCALKQLLADGNNLSNIAMIFCVSRDLVTYRMKVTRLYRRL